MNTNHSELKHLITLLNCDWTQAPLVVKRLYAGPKFKRVRRTEIKHYAQVAKFHEAMRYLIAPIVDPDLAVPEFKGDPSQMLRMLIHNMNEAFKRHAVRPQWALASQKSGKPNLHLRGFAWRLNRINVDSSAIAEFYHAFARVLETDQLSRLGVCRICFKFFVRNRPWQKCCTDKCKKTLDNRLYAEKRAKQSGNKWKEMIAVALEENTLIKRLDSTPHGRWLIRAKLENQLKSAETADAFWSACDPKIKRTLENYLEDRRT